MAGFYHRFIPNFSGIAAPLIDLTQNIKKLDKHVLPEDSKKSFEQLKMALAKCVTLAFPCPNSNLELTTDASGATLGSVLH